MRVETDVKAGEEPEPYDPNEPLEARLWKPGSP